jgi:hypothetical protein
MLNAAFNAIAGDDDGSNTPKTVKDVLKHKYQKGWWDCTKKEFQAMETYGKFCLCHPCHLEEKSLVTDGYTVKKMMELSDQERFQSSTRQSFYRKSCTSYAQPSF